MTKLGSSLVSGCVGLVAGLLLGYALFQQDGRTLPENGRAPSAASGLSGDTSAVRQFYYRVSDSTLARHTVSGSGDGVVHTVDTVAVTWK